MVGTNFIKRLMIPHVTLHSKTQDSPLSEVTHTTLTVIHLHPSNKKYSGSMYQSETEINRIRFASHHEEGAPDKLSNHVEAIIQPRCAISRHFQAQEMKLH